MKLNQQGGTFMRTLLLSCALLGSVLCAQEPSRPRLKALFIYDTSSKEIKKASMADVQRVRKIYGTYTKGAGASFKTLTTTREKLTNRVIKSWIKTLHPSTEESVIVYYAGNGQTILSSQWPQIGMKNGKALRMKDLLQRLAKKKIVQGMVLFDCYSQALTYKNGGSKKGINKKTLAKLKFAPLMKKYSIGKSTILMGTSGTNVAQTYYSTQPKPTGGIFTSMFLFNFLKNANRSL